MIATIDRYIFMLNRYYGDMFEAFLWMLSCAVIGAVCMWAYLLCRYRAGIRYQKNKESHGWQQ